MVKISGGNISKHRLDFISNIDEGMNIANRFKKSIANDELWKIMAGHGTMLTNNGIKSTIKVIKPLKNCRILLNGTTEKNTSQKEGLLGNFLASLMRVDLPLMESVLT